MAFRYTSADGSIVSECDLDCEQCIAQTKNGTRCRRNTCKVLPYCVQHLKVNLGLIIAESSLPDAGFGLFTIRRIAKDAVIAPYLGRILSFQQKERAYGSERDDLAPYAIEMSKNKFIDAACRRGAGAFANSKPSQNNARFKVNSRTNTAFVVATKTIDGTPLDPGEIFVSYGQRYWTKHAEHRPVFHTSTRKGGRNSEDLKGGAEEGARDQGAQK